MAYYTAAHFSILNIDPPGLYPDVLNWTCRTDTSNGFWGHHIQWKPDNTGLCPSHAGCNTWSSSSMKSRRNKPRKLGINFSVKDQNAPFIWFDFLHFFKLQAHQRMTLQVLLEILNSVIHRSTNPKKCL